MTTAAEFIEDAGRDVPVQPSRSYGAPLGAGRGDSAGP